MFIESYSFSWLFGGHTDQFVSQSDRIFISMDGTLYFSYNKKEDATRFEKQHLKIKKWERNKKDYFLVMHAV